VGPGGESIVGRISRTVDRKAALVVDATGVGKPVVDYMRREGLTPIPVTIHGGDQVTFDQGFRVPKRDLAGVVKVLLDSKRLKVAPSHPLAAALTMELLAFRVKISQLTGHDSYGAGTEWRDGGAHDDLVLALACAAWYAEYRLGGPLDDNPNQWATVYA
jgi:hypothetical protein